MKQVEQKYIFPDFPMFFISGITKLFKYDYHSLPFKIFNQPEEEELCYEVTDDMELVFTFMRVSKLNKNLIWRFAYSSFVQRYFESLSAILVDYRGCLQQNSRVNLLFYR